MLPIARLLVLPLVCALAPGAYAGDPVPAAPAPAPAKPAPALKLADDAAAREAIAVFKEAWKAKGLKGDERLSQRDFALSELVKLQHPLVVAELGDVSRSGDGVLRTLAVIYLGDQKALPALAGEQVLLAFKKNADDTVLLLSALQSLVSLKYLGAAPLLKDLVRSEDFVLKKAALTAVGQLGDARLIDELLKLLGVDPKAVPATSGGGEDDKNGGKEVVEEGYSWEGAEATADHGDADNTNENAEAKAKAESQIAQNKAAAQAGASGGSGGGASGGDGGTGGGRGGAARSKDEVKPLVLKALRALTGETFMSSKEIRTWLGAHGGELEAAKAKCAATEAEQRAAAKK